MNIVFAGTPEFAAQHLSGLIEHGLAISTVITQPDKPGKRGKRLVPSPVKLLAESHGMTVLQPQKISVEDLSELAPDLLIVVAYGQILKQNLLDLPTHGCINVHGSILPRWRGAAPIQRAIEAGDNETGICIMQMDAGLDTGPVLYEARTKIVPGDTAAQLSDQLAQLGIAGLMEVVSQIREGKLSPRPQPEEGTYAKKITKQEARVDWSDTAANIMMKVHAFNPDPVCYCECPMQDKAIRMKLYECQYLEGNPGDPGEILAVTADGVTVATGAGHLLIEKLQLPLGKGSLLSGRDVMNSRQDILYPGLRLN